MILKPDNVSGLQDLLRATKAPIDGVDISSLATLKKTCTRRHDGYGGSRHDSGRFSDRHR